MFISADEPAGRLCTWTAGALHEELLNLSRTDSGAFVIATHNPDLHELGHDASGLQDGELWENSFQGHGRDIFIVALYFYIVHACTVNRTGATDVGSVLID